MAAPRPPDRRSKCRCQSNRYQDRADGHYTIVNTLSTFHDGQAWVLTHVCEYGAQAQRPAAQLRGVHAEN